MIRRFAVLGDIHTEDRRLAAAIAHFDREGFETVLSVGDIVDGPGDVNRTVELLKARGVQTVRGNHDRWITNDMLVSPAERRMMGWTVRTDIHPDALAWITALPVTLTLPTVVGPLLLCHGVGDDDMTKLYAVDTRPLDNDDLRAILAERHHRLVVCGHTHERWVTRFGPLWWLNAGTLTERNGDPGVMTVDLEARQVQFWDVDATGAVSAADSVTLQD